jgi:DNA-binding NtrC family response regulator
MSTQDHLLDRADTSTLRGRRILIVEDELLVALETKALIWGFGGIVVGPCARVAAALEAIQLQPIDGAILDINVAGTQSFVIADALQPRNIPFIFYTGHGRDIVPPRFKDVVVIEKPVAAEMLVAALADAFAARTSHPAR